MKILSINFIKNPFNKEKLYCFIISSLLLVLIYILYILEYNNENYLIVYVLDSDKINTDLTINTTKKIIDENFSFKFFKFLSQYDKVYYPSSFVGPNFDYRSSSIMFNPSEDIKYKNSSIISILGYRYKIEQECILKLEDKYKLKLK